MDALAPVRALLEDKSINEIMINGPRDVFYRQSGPDKRYETNLTGQQIATGIKLLASMGDKEVNADNLILSAKLPGFRVECCLPPVAVKGASMCIRRHNSRVLTLEDYLANGVMVQEQVDIIKGLVEQRKNFLIAGGTYSGKTTLMNCVLSLVDPHHRLFVIEQIPELQIVAPNHVLVECDPEQGVTARRAVIMAMRYSPDRIVLGELRGPEAYEWIVASNTGHPGSAATIHANDSSAALQRLSNLILMADTGMPHAVIQNEIASTVDAVLFIEQKHGKRLLSELCFIKGFDREAGRFITEVHHHPLKPRKEKQA